MASDKRPRVPRARAVGDLDYDSEALAEIELASDVMIAANSTEALDDGELDRVLGLPASDG